MLIEKGLLAIIGLCSGLAVSAGIFAFITMLGIIPRLAARTDTAKHIYLYEKAIIWGGTAGNIWYLFQTPLHLSAVFLCVAGAFFGVFVGCLSMALAEMLKVLPIMVKRARIREGFPVVVAAIAAGKLTGTIFQFFFR